MTSRWLLSPARHAPPLQSKHMSPLSPLPRGARTLARTLLPLLVTVACRHPAATTVTPTAPRSTEEHCWWTPFRTPLPRDSVAARLQQAFVATGLDAARRRQAGDTTWVASGPTVVAANLPRATYRARAVAIGHADGTHYRVYVAVDAPPEGWADADEATQGGRYVIPMCGAIARAAALRGVPSAQSAEDTLAVWTRPGPP